MMETIDKKEQYFYVILNSALQKYDMTNKKYNNTDETHINQYKKSLNTIDFFKFVNELIFFFKIYNKNIDGNIILLIFFYSNHPQLIIDKNAYNNIVTISECIKSIAYLHKCKFSVLHQLFQSYNELCDLIKNKNVFSNDIHLENIYYNINNCKRGSQNSNEINSINHKENYRRGSQHMIDDSKISNVPVMVSSIIKI